MRPARRDESYASGGSLLCTAIVVVNLCVIMAIPVARQKAEKASNVGLLQEVTCLFKGFTAQECADDKRTRKMGELTEDIEDALLNPMALVQERLAEIPRSQPKTAPAKSSPAKKQDGFYSDW